MLTHREIRVTDRVSYDYVRITFSVQKKLEDGEIKIEDLFCNEDGNEHLWDTQGSPPEFFYRFKWALPE